MQTGRVVAEIAKRKVEVGSDLDLVLEAPGLHHGGTPVGLAQRVDRLSVGLRRVKVGSVGQQRKSCIHLRAGKRIPGEQRLVLRESLQRALAEIGVDQRSVINAAVAAQHHLVMKERRSPRESNPRLKISVVGGSPGFSHVAVASRALAGKYQRAGGAGRAGDWGLWG